MPPAPGHRIVLLTGASSGIGRESALRFARLGDTVVGVASSEPALRALEARTVDVRPLVSTRVPLERAEEALQAAAAPGVLKVLVTR